MKKMFLLVFMVIFTGCAVEEVIKEEAQFSLVKKVLLADGRKYVLLYDNLYANEVRVDHSSEIELEYEGYLVTVEIPNDYIILAGNEYLTTWELYQIVTPNQYKMFGFNVRKEEISVILQDTLVKNLLINGEEIIVMRYAPDIVCVEGGPISYIQDGYEYIISDICPLYLLSDGVKIGVVDLFEMVDFDYIRFNKLGVGKITKRKL